MAIIIPGDPERARQALEQRRLREAEEADRRRLDVEDAIAKGDVVQMATLWLDRRGNLASDRCDESVRDMNLLTPELAHAANDESLPYNYMLTVRDLRGSSSLFTSGPMTTLLARASLQIKDLRFAVEAKQRAAKKAALAPSLVDAPPATVSAQGTPPTPPGAVPLPTGAEKPGQAPAPTDGLEFTAVEKAIVLLIRDGRQPRSMRDYAGEVGVAHTTLGRNGAWQRAWDAAQSLSEKNREDLPSGSKDTEGNLQAWINEACENCRQERITCAVTVTGETMRVCEKCAQKLGSRTDQRPN